MRKRLGRVLLAAVAATRGDAHITKCSPAPTSTRPSSCARALVSVATSIDGYINDMDDAQLLLSNSRTSTGSTRCAPASMPSWSGTKRIRRDNLRLLVRSVARQEERVRRGLAPHPMKVTLTGRGDLDATARFFSSGDIRKDHLHPWSCSPGTSRGSRGCRHRGGSRRADRPGRSAGRPR